jgi:hypothetical protein
MFEAIVEQDQAFHLTDIEQGLRLFAAFDLVRAQQFRAPGSDAVALWFHQPRLAVIDEAESAPVANRGVDVVVQVSAPPTHVKGMLMRRLA